MNTFNAHFIGAKKIDILKQRSFAKTDFNDNDIRTTGRNEE